jgi:hypothetical protein
MLPVQVLGELVMFLAINRLGTEVRVKLAWLIAKDLYLRSN